MAAFDSLTQRLTGAFKKLKNKGKLSEEDIKLAMREVRIALLEADVNMNVAKDFVNKVSRRAVGSEVMDSLTPAQQVVKIVREELTDLMGSENARIKIANRGPTVVMMCGLQGAGKTTHAAKIAKYFLKLGHRPLLAALDIYRPAAIEQLEIVANQAGVPVFQLGKTDPVIVARKAYNYAVDYGHDFLILDTAGRLQIDEQLMAELSNIKKEIPVTETLLVIDALAGQDAVNVASEFNEKIGLDGVIITKMDGDSRGGVALSVKAVTGKPIKFVGTGEKLDDLEIFYPDRMANRILDMGDMLSFIDKVQSEFDEKQAKETADRMLKNKFDMNDMLNQLQQMQKMGGVSAMISMMPGASKISEEDEEKAENELKKTEAIIYSMTKKEREKPSVIDSKRKRRIAAGSGTQVQDVNKLLRQFEQTQKIMKRYNKNPKAFSRMMKGM
jgi:signal recognition particle subunit SRP54